MSDDSTFILVHAGWLHEVLTRLAEIATRDVTAQTAAEAITFAKAAVAMYATVPATDLPVTVEERGA